MKIFYLDAIVAIYFSLLNGGGGFQWYIVKLKATFRIELRTHPLQPLHLNRVNFVSMTCHTYL